MATTPHPAQPQKPGVPPPPPTGNHPAVGGGHLTTQGEAAHAQRGPGGYGPTIGVKGEPIDDGERDPDTIAEEQRRRSDEMEKEGITAWIAAHDTRKGDEAAPKSITATVKIEGQKAP